MKKTMTPQEERMVLLYRKADRRLFGHIAFYKKGHPDQKTAGKPYRESKPFAIGRYLENGDDSLEVLGSVVFLLEEIRQVIRGFLNDNNGWHARRGRLTSEAEIAKADRAYDRQTMQFVLLASLHTRNLMDLMPRFNDRSIPRLDYANPPDGQVTLRELFDVLIHNRYYYFDGAHVRDLFSDDFKKKNSALSGRFMGYGFDILDFVKGVSAIIEEVTVKDLTQLLWRRFKELSAESKPQEVISLVQNVHDFSELLKAKIPTAGYEFMTSLMFEDLDDTLQGVTSETQQDGTTVDTQTVFFTSPHIGIASDLDKKEFEIRFRRSVGRQDPGLVREDLKDHKTRIGFEEFFRKVKDAFGNDRVLSGPPQRFASASVDRN